MKFTRPLAAGFAMAALVLSPISAFAQDAPAETPAVETPAAPAENAGAAPAEGAGSVASAVDNLASQNWLKVCDPLPDGQQACIMRQVVLANGQFVGSFLLRDDPGQESRLLAIASVPLGVLLPFGMTWQIDNEQQPRRVHYMLCDPTACASQLVVDERYVNMLKAGNKLILKAKNRQMQDLTVEINLAGFTATYDGGASITFEQLRQEEAGQNALEQVLQDRAEQLRQQLGDDAAPPAAEGEQPAPAAQ